jgi:hypothetical protein
MARQSQLRTAIYAVETADCGDRLGRRDAARDGRAAAMLRRRQLAQGKKALNGGGDGAAAGARTFIVLRGGAG